jgi:hypothetical protein
MPAPLQKKLHDIKLRSTSIGSQVSVKSSTSEFLENKVQQLDAELDYLHTYRTGLLKARESGELTKEQYDAALKELDRDMIRYEEETVTVKRQKRLILADMDDELPRYENMEDAYISVIVGKVMSASKQKSSTFNQSAFKKAVLQFYGASRPSSDDSRAGEEFCHLSGWHEVKYKYDKDGGKEKMSPVRAAHLVPKSLQSEELAYTFGAGAIDLGEARNGEYFEHDQ